MTQVLMYANISDKEFFRINGTLPPERIGPLLDAAAFVREVEDGVKIKLREARGSIPSESDITEALSTVRDQIRGLRGRAVTQLMSALDEAEQSLIQSCEYAHSEIKDACDSLKV